MMREISRWGVGPSIMVSAGAYAAVAGLATRLWPEFCLVSAVSRMVFLVAGIVLLVIGVPMLLFAARAATLAYNSDKLATTGIFGLTRNPIYSAWIVFIIPGLVLFEPLLAAVADTRGGVHRVQDQDSARIRVPGETVWRRLPDVQG